MTLETAAELEVSGFDDDTLVREALLRLSQRVGCDPGWHVRIEKRIPVAAGLGGGSSDAATALRLANDAVTAPLGGAQLHMLAAELGADVPFFLYEGPQLGTGDGTELQPLAALPELVVLLILPAGEQKQSTADVYRRFDRRDGAVGFEERRRALVDRLHDGLRAEDLPSLPRNDLVSSPLADRLEELGALRADVSGAGPVVYGLFADAAVATSAADAVHEAGRIWATSLCC